MAGLPSDKRVPPRVPVQLAVDYASAHELVSDVTVNLSIGGTFIITDRDVEVGTEVDLSLTFPGLLVPIALKGTVRWCQDRGGGIRGVGIEFCDLEDGTVAQLQDLMKAIERGDPGLVTTPVNVLLVDDNRHVSALIEQGLTLLSARSDKPLSFVFHCAFNGREGLEMAGELDPDLIIVDLHLPEIDGISVITQLRASGRKTAIVAISSQGDEGRQQALEAGANTYVPKPMRLRELGDAVRAVIGDM